MEVIGQRAAAFQADDADANWWEVVDIVRILLWVAVSSSLGRGNRPVRTPLRLLGRTTRCNRGGKSDHD